MSLNKYINEILQMVELLRVDVKELQRENRELKDMLTHTHHRWWTAELQKADDLIKQSGQPDYLQY